ncbi:UNVERIFIED_CONTAM: hypothetical protein FKN15_008569 [Acipenser sinensis]
MSINKRKVLSIEDKIKIINYISSGKKTQVKKYDLRKTMVNTVMKNRDKIMRQYEQGGSKGTKLIRTATFAEVDEALLQWFKSARTINLPLSSPIRHEKADALSCKNFFNNTGWLERWKKRNYII